MRISDWSSDVCSSDLHRTDHARSAGHGVEELHHGTAQRQGSLPQAFLFADARYHCRGAARTCAQGGVEPGMTILSRSHRAKSRCQSGAHYLTVSRLRSPRSEEHTSELQSLMRTSY